MRFCNILLGNCTIFSYSWLGFTQQNVTERLLTLQDAFPIPILTLDRLQAWLPAARIGLSKGTLCPPPNPLPCW